MNSNFFPSGFTSAPSKPAFSSFTVPDLYPGKPRCRLIELAEPKRRQIIALSYKFFFLSLSLFFYFVGLFKMTWFSHLLQYQNADKKSMIARE